MVCRFLLLLSLSLYFTSIIFLPQFETTSQRDSIHDTTQRNIFLPRSGQDIARHSNILHLGKKSCIVSYNTMLKFSFYLLCSVLDLLRHFLFFFLWLIICHFGRPLGSRSANWTALGGSGFFEASEGVWMKLHLIRADNYVEIRRQCGRQRGHLDS